MSDRSVDQDFSLSCRLQLHLSEASSGQSQIEYKAPCSVSSGPATDIAGSGCNPVGKEACCNLPLEYHLKIKGKLTKKQNILLYLVDETLF